MLRAVANVLVGCIRQADTAARLGGDEFAVLIEHIDGHSDIVTLAERILNALRLPVTLDTTEVVATASIGITFGVPGSTGEQLLRNADLAMYMAKEHGKNCYEEFRDQMHTAIVERLELEADLRRTTTGKELVVHYQPIVELETEEIIGFEALVRWQHPLGDSSRRAPSFPSPKRSDSSTWSTVSSWPRRAPSSITGRRAAS